MQQDDYKINDDLEPQEPEEDLFDGDDGPVCRVCGCTDDNACPGGCYWVEDPECIGDLCSRCAEKLDITRIAKVCHEVNRAYCESLGDTSQDPWNQAPDWQKQSCINGVKMHLENPDVTPRQSHENWMREKAAAGWVYGPVKDPEKKTHPCMVPYGQLPQEQRSKDYIFKAIVDCLRWER